MNFFNEQGFSIGNPFPRISYSSGVSGAGFRIDIGPAGLQGGQSFSIFSSGIEIFSITNSGLFHNNEIIPSSSDFFEINSGISGLKSEISEISGDLTGISGNIFEISGNFSNSLNQISGDFSSSLNQISGSVSGNFNEFLKAQKVDMAMHIAL